MSRSPLSHRLAPPGEEAPTHTYTVPGLQRVGAAFFSALLLIVFVLLSSPHWLTTEWWPYAVFGGTALFMYWAAGHVLAVSPRYLAYRNMGRKYWVIFEDLTAVDLEMRATGMHDLKFKDTNHSVRMEVNVDYLSADRDVWNMLVAGVDRARKKGTVRLNPEADILLDPDVFH